MDISTDKLFFSVNYHMRYATFENLVTSLANDKEIYFVYESQHSRINITPLRPLPIAEAKRLVMFNDGILIVEN